MGENLDFAGKILIDRDQGVNIILNVYRAAAWNDYGELIILTCYRPITKSYTIYLYPDKHEIKSAIDYLGEGDYQRLTHFLVRERRTLLESARERAVTDIKYRWENCFKRALCKKYLKYPTLVWAKDGLRELEECPEKYIIWELE